MEGDEKGGGRASPHATPRQSSSGVRPVADGHGAAAADARAAADAEGRRRASGGRRRWPSQPQAQCPSEVTKERWALT